MGEGAVRCRERLGGLLKYYERESTGQRTMGSQRIYRIYSYIKDAGNLPWQKTSRTCFIFKGR